MRAASATPTLGVVRAAWAAAGWPAETMLARCAAGVATADEAEGVSALDLDDPTSTEGPHWGLARWAEHLHGMSAFPRRGNAELMRAMLQISLHIWMQCRRECALARSRDGRRMAGSWPTSILHDVPFRRGCLSLPASSWFFWIVISTRERCRIITYNK